MVARKIQDEGELERWYNEGMTYKEMAYRYLVKYNLEVSPTLFSSWRKRKGLDKRIVRDDHLIPWEVKPEHRYNYEVSMLRLVGRQRAGRPLSDLELQRVTSWVATLEEDQAVIHYDPETEQGFWRIPREPGDDDLIRRPDRATTRMPNVET